MKPIRSALLTAKRQRGHFDAGGLTRNIPGLTVAAAPAQTTVSQDLGEVSVPAATDTAAADAASQTAGYNASDQNASAVTSQTTDSASSSSNDPSSWKTWFGYTPTQDDYNQMLKLSYGENFSGNSYDQYRAIFESIGNRLAANGNGVFGANNHTLYDIANDPKQYDGLNQTQNINLMKSSNDPNIVASRNLAQQALNDYFTEGQNKVLTTQTDFRGFQNNAPSPGTDRTNRLDPGSDVQGRWNTFYDPQNKSIAANLADLQAKNNAIWQDPNQTYAFKEPGTSTVNVTGVNDTQGPNVATTGITDLKNITGSDTAFGNEETNYITSPTVTNDPFSGVMSSNLNLDNANPLVGNTGLSTDTNQIQTNSTGITGQDIIPYGTGLDLNNGTMGVSSNGISNSPMLTGIDTGFNPSGNYGIDPSGGLGPGGFGFNSFDVGGFKRGGFVDKALRAAHRAAGGQVDLPSVPVTPNKYQDLRRRMLETPAPMSGQQEDLESRKYNYLQDAPGPQVRGPTFARGGYADGGPLPDDTDPATDNVQPGDSLLLNDISKNKIPTGFTSDDEGEPVNFKPLNFDNLIKSGAARVTNQGYSGSNYNADPSAGFSIVSGWNDALSPTNGTKDWPNNPQAYDVVRNMFLNEPENITPHKYRQIIYSAQRLGLKPEEIYAEKKSDGGTIPFGSDAARNAVEIAKQQAGRRSKE